jgi:outer membrane immunogenic protein
MLNRVILTAASIVALSVAANAADMYRPSAGGYKDVPYVGVNWSGLYFGANAGYAWDSKDSSVNTGIGGAQIGYNIQRGNMVFGVETDIDAAGNGLDYIGTVRGRAGLTFDRALVYGTGGFAYAGSNCNGCSNVDGWVAGGGVEYKFSPAWSMKAEYQHLELQNLSPSEGVDTLRLGVNYFVGGGYDPLK